MPLEWLPYFTDPDKRRAYHEREIPGPEGDNNLWDGACVYRLAPDGSLTVLAHCEYPNGLALSPDERTMYVANTRSSQYIHGINLDAAGNMVGTVMANSDVDGGTPSDLSAGDGYPSDLRAAELGDAAAAFLQHREHTLPGRQAVDRAAGLGDLAGPAREGRNPQSGDWLPRSTRIRTN